MSATADRRARIDALGYAYEARELEPVVECNLCGGVHHVEVSRTDRYGFAAVFRVCALCGLGFLGPRMTSREYGEFYTGTYRPLVSAYHGRTIDAETVQVEQREYAADLVDFLRAHLPAHVDDVLDLGGSTGIVAAAVRDAFGAAATVLDPAPAELEVAAAAGMETIEGFAEEIDVGGRQWQLVLLCQTIDHLLDIAATLAAMHGLLAPGGWAFVDVLDVDFMARRRGSIEGAVKIDHPYYLTRATALAYFVRAGLSVVAERMSDDGHWGFLLARAEPGEPDWARLRRGADALLATCWQLRAKSR
jgi:SAM-dependent methyltransferase